MRTTPFLIAITASCILFASQPTKTVIDNDDVRVLDALQDPRVKTKLHEHKANRVMIYRDAGQQEIVMEDGGKTVLKFSRNEVLWSAAAGRHTSEITSAGPVPIIEIELRKPGAGKTVSADLDPVKVDPKHYKAEFENDQVRVLRIRFGAHETAPLHEHKLTRIVLFVTDTQTRMTSSEGKVDETPHKAGDISLSAPAKHSEYNTLDHPIEMLVTELKY